MVITSFRSLAGRWRWSVRRVQSYLEYLEGKQYIKVLHATPDATLTQHATQHAICIISASYKESATPNATPTQHPTQHAKENPLSSFSPTPPLSLFPEENIAPIKEKSITDVIDTKKSSPSPSSAAPPPHEKNFDFLSALLHLGVTPQTAGDWLTVRRLKKAANTKTAFIRIANEIERSGAAAEDCVAMAVEKSWMGFRAQWYINEKTRYNESNDYRRNQQQRPPIRTREKDYGESTL